MLLTTHGSIEWLTHMAISIFFLIVLVDWVTFLLLITLGIVLGFLFYTQVVGPVNIQLGFIGWYLVVYQGLFATFIGLLFARKKEQKLDQLALQNQSLLVADLENKESLLEAVREKVHIIQTLKHAGIQDLLQVARLIRDLHVRVKAQAPSLLSVISQLEKLLIPMTLQIRGIEDRSANFLRLDVKRITLKTLLEEVQAQVAIKSKGIQIKWRVSTQCQELECDPKRIQSLLVGSITALQTAPDRQPVLVGIEDAQLHYALSSVKPGYVKKVPALRFTVTSLLQLPALQPSYMAQLNGAELTAPETAQELVLLKNQRIVKAHYGFLNATADSLCYVIPLHLGEVRPSDLDQPYMELGATPVRANDRYPGAQEQEKEFLQAVNQKSTADIELIKSVIELIKWYHGPVNRKSGEPFYLHPVAVAQIVLDYNQDEATILAALLHDAVEDTSLLLEDIEAAFGTDAGYIVDTVTHLESTKGGLHKVRLSAEENIMMLVESGDDRAMYVKLADRMHNMRTIQAKPHASQKRSAQETIQFYVPQAKRLGLYKVAEEFTALSMGILNKEG